MKSKAPKTDYEHEHEDENENENTDAFINSSMQPQRGEPYQPGATPQEVRSEKKDQALKGRTN